MAATFNGLAATGDSRAAGILLAQAQPGNPERIRLYALVGLGDMKAVVAQDHKAELLEVVRAALHDPFFLVQEAGEELVGAYKLKQFRSDIQDAAQGAPTIMQREPAQKVLEQLDRQQ